MARTGSLKGERDTMTHYQLTQLAAKPHALDGTPFSSAVVDFHSTTAELLDAVRESDNMAESYAEREREYQRVESAKAQIEELTEELQINRESLRALLRELKTTAGINPKGTVCAALRAQIRSMRGFMHRAYLRRQTLQNEI